MGMFTRFHKCSVLACKNSLTLLMLFALLLSPTLIQAENKSGVKPSVLSLPSGPGSIEGLGESFEPQLNSGVGSYQVPLKTLPGRAGFQPGMAFQYNAGYGNGVLGVGWQLGVPYLQRQTDKGLPFYTDWGKPDTVDNDRDGMVDEADEADTIIHSGGEELVPLDDGTFRFENESAFTKFEPLDEGGWQAWQKDGTRLTFGTLATSRVEDDQGRVFRWLVDEMVDTHGNTITFTHQSLDATDQKYYHSITYNNTMVIRFEYEARSDVVDDYRPRFRLITAYRLANVVMEQNGSQVRRYQLNYHAATDLQPHSLLASIQEFGADNTSSLPPAQFTYTEFNGASAVPQNIASAPGFSLNDGDIDLYDVNADGLPDILDTRDGLIHSYYLNNGPGEQGEVSFADRATMLTTDAGHLQLSLADVQLADIDGNSRSNLLDVNNDLVFVWGMQKQGSGFQWQSQPYVGQAAFNFQNADTQLVDLNNDKLVDVVRINDNDVFAWINTKNGTWSSAFSGFVSHSNLELSNSNVRLADMNGDRLQDIVRFGDSFVVYYPNMGLGAFGQPITMTNAPFDIQNYQNFLFYDVNGDGLADAIYVGGDVKVWLNKGLDHQNYSQGQFAAYFTVAKPYTSSGITTFRQVDMNANGTTDILFNTSPGGGLETFSFIDFSPGEKPYQLKTIGNGIGKTTTISYRSSIVDFLRDKAEDRPWPEPMPFPVSVVSRVDTFDGLNTYSTTMHYHDGYYDAEEQEFRGFAAAEQVDVGGSDAPSLYTTFVYDTGVSSDALKGKPLVSELKNAAGEIFYSEIYQWQTREIGSQVALDKQVTFPFQAQRIRNVIEKDTGTPVNLRWNYEYDNYGNTTKVTEHGRLDAGWNDERITENQYTSSCTAGLDQWILSKPVRQTVTTLGGAKVSETLSFYDNQGTCGISKGNLTRSDQWVSGNQYTTEKRDYDTYGNVTAIYDPLHGQAEGHYRTIAYDNQYHTFPISETIYVSGQKNLSLSASYDPGFGVVTSSTDFNGHNTTYTYDTFGRLTSIIKPLDSNPTVEYDYVLAHSIGNNQYVNWVETRQRESQSGGTVDSRQFYDGLGRHIMTRSEGESAGQVVVSDTVQFNQRQTPYRRYLPYFETGTLDFNAPTYQQAYTQHQYDALGREIRVTQPDGTYSTTVYEPLVRTVKDEEQTKKAGPHSQAAMRYEEDGLQDKDGKGRLRKVTEIFDNGQHWLTQYRYDLLDNLTGYTDSQGNQKHIEYDGLSRKTFMNDPDRGHMTYAYDAASNLVSTLDAKQQTIKMTYDGASRILTETYGLNNDTPDVQYIYDHAHSVSQGEFWQDKTPTQQMIDALLKENYAEQFDLNIDGQFDVADVLLQARQTPSENPIPTVTSRNNQGQLSKVIDKAGEQVFSYDNRGRSEWTVRGIKDHQGTLNHFYTAMAYDSMDRVTELTYPDKSKVSYTYNGRGLLETVPGAITGLDYNPAGQNLRLARANGTTTQYDYDGRLRLQRLHSTNSALQLQDLTYTYDAVSNITAITDGRSNTVLDQIGDNLQITQEKARKFNATQAFTYDNLYRLTKAENTQVYGSITYAYDQIGNMVSKTANLNESDPLMDLGTMRHGGAGGSSSRNGRADNDAPGPHALTGWGEGENEQTMGYDANGNVINERGQTYTWDFKDRLVQMDKTGTTANYVYDYQDQRKHKAINNDPFSQVFYIDKYSEVRKGKLIKYVYAGSQRIARSRAHTPDEFEAEDFYLHDHLGSTNLATSGSGNVTEQLVNHPFGRSRQVANISSGAQSFYRFTGKERDAESELQYFEARYLGVAGQFVNVDPLVQRINSNLRYSPQRINSYSYGNNNPVIMIDSNGESATATGFLIGFAGGALGSMARDFFDGKPISLKGAAKMGLAAGVAGAAVGLVIDTGGAALAAGSKLLATTGKVVTDVATVVNGLSKAQKLIGAAVAIKYNKAIRNGLSKIADKTLGQGARAFKKVKDRLFDFGDNSEKAMQSVSDGANNYMNGESTSVQEKNLDDFTSNEVQEFQDTALDVMGPTSVESYGGSITEHGVRNNE